MNCVGCNKELLDNAKFCRFCGVSQTVKPPPVITPTVSAQPSTEPACKKCGNVLLANAKFCKHCGESASNVIPTPPPAASTAPPPPVTSIKTNQNTPNVNQIPVNNLAVKRNKNLLIPALILLAVCIISTLVYVLKFSDSSEIKQPEATNAQEESLSVIAKTEEETPLKTESELHVLTEDELGQIPFSDRVDENDEPDADAKEFEKSWKGKTISLKFGGIKISENVVFCEPEIKGLNPNSIVTGVLDSRLVGGSGGNPIVLKNCHVEKSNENSLANATQNNFTYESSVTLHGKLVSATGEGGDEKIHTYPALQLEQAISVLGSDELNVTEQGILLIQLSLNETLFKLYEELIGKDVSVTGTLYHSHTGHHYTSVLMDTSAIKNVGSKSAALNLKPSKDIADSKQQPQASTKRKSKNYQQLFICSSDMNYLPAANTLAKTLINYYSAGQDVGYQAVMNSSASHFNGSSIGGGCVQHGFKVEELPQGNKVLYAQNDKLLFWLVETKGLGGGAYTAVAEYK